MDPRLQGQKLMQIVGHAGINAVRIGCDQGRNGTFTGILFAQDHRTRAGGLQIAQVGPVKKERDAG